MNFNDIVFYIFNIILILIEVALFIRVNQLLKVNFLLRTLFFFILYGLQTSILIITVHFTAGKHVIYSVFSTVDKSVVVQDPQDYLVVLWESGLCIVFLVLFCLATFYFHFLLSGALRKEEFLMYQVILTLIYYHLIISIIIFLTDILFYHWEIFYPEKMFDFQPDLLSWFFHYKAEYIDVLGLLCFITALYVYLFFGQDNYLEILKTNTLWRFVPFSIFVLYSLYLFGGESLSRDIWLICCSFFSGELVLFSKISFEIFKRYKDDIV